ncbi:MAG TPA: hypothetical protein DCG49_09015 [Ruminococcus sp.]|nr:hypothetical protein [Ruminococcus sp.]
MLLIFGKRWAYVNMLIFFFYRRIVLPNFCAHHCRDPRKCVIGFRGIFLFFDAAADPFFSNTLINANNLSKSGEA